MWASLKPIENFGCLTLNWGPQTCFGDWDLNPKLCLTNSGMSVVHPCFICYQNIFLIIVFWFLAATSSYITRLFSLAVRVCVAECPKFVVRIFFFYFFLFFCYNWYWIMIVSALWSYLVLDTYSLIFVKCSLLIFCMKLGLQKCPSSSEQSLDFWGNLNYAFA